MRRARAVMAVVVPVAGACGGDEAVTTITGAQTTGTTTPAAVESTISTTAATTTTTAATTTTAPPTTSTTTTSTTTTTTAPPTTTSAAGGGDELVMHENPEVGFRLLYPAAWRVHEGVEDVAVLFAEPGYPDAISVWAYADPPGITRTPDEWVEARYAEIAGAMGAAEPEDWVAEEGGTRLGTGDAWYVFYGATSPDGIAVFFTEVIAVPEGRGFVVAWTVLGEPTSFRTFGEMAESFEVITDA